MNRRTLALLSVAAVTLSGCSSQTGGNIPDESAAALNDAISEKTLQLSPGLDVDNTLSIRNAYWTARLSSLAYTKLDLIPAELKKLKPVGAKDFVFQKWDDKKYDLQAYYVGTEDWGVLTFRGSEMNLQDWVGTNGDMILQNAAAPGLIAAHRGFSKGLDRVWGAAPDSADRTGIRYFLKDHGHNLESEKPLYITGHSLGGALATLATQRALFDGCYGLPVQGDFATRQKLWQDHNLSIQQLATGRTMLGKFPLDWGMSPTGTALRTNSCMNSYIPVSALYTFGQPKVGARSMAELIANRAETLGTSLFRFHDKQDAVPLLPYGMPQYVHVGKKGTDFLYYLTAEGSIKPNAAEAPALVFDGRFGPAADHKIGLYTTKILKNAGTGGR